MKVFIYENAQRTVSENDIGEPKIQISQHWKKLLFQSTKIIYHFRGTKIIFADSIINDYNRTESCHSNTFSLSKIGKFSVKLDP